MATIKDVAKLARVSQSTVSHVLNGTKFVSPGLRARVWSAIDALGYRPNVIAKSLRTHVTHSLGIIVSNMLDYSFNLMIKGITQATVKDGFVISLFDSEERWSREEEHIWAVLSRQIDGLVIAPVGGGEKRALREASAGGLPIALLDDTIPGLNVGSVMADYEKGAYEATIFHIEAGHDRVGFIVNWIDSAARQAAFTGYQRACTERGVVLDPALIRTNDRSIVGGYKAFIQLTRLRRPPTAILVMDHAMTLGAIRAIHELGLRCPGDICLLGLGDFEWAEATTPQITVISPSYYDIGYAAGRMVTTSIAQRTPDPDPARLLLPVRLIIRQSTCSVPPIPSREAVV